MSNFPPPPARPKPPAGESAFQIGHVLSETFSIYGRRFGAFVLVAALFALPAFVLRFIFGVDPIAAAQGHPADPKLGVIVAALAIPFQVVGQVMITDGAFAELSGGRFVPGNSLRVALSRFLPALGVWFMSFVIGMVGVMLLVVPGAIAFCMFFVAFPACVAERLGSWPSMQRSRTLTKGVRWKLFALLLLIFIPGALLGFGFVYAAKLGLPPIGVQIAYYGFTFVWAAFNAIFFAVAFRQLRAAKEGFDTERLTQVFE
jgi:hypothetical protein